MSSYTFQYKFLETFACAHVSDGFMENDGDKMLGYFTKMQETTPLAKVRELKEKGNGMFRQNDFDLAAACYDEACKLLSLRLGSIGGEDIQNLSDLVVSLISNMAACALKLEEYRAASGMCSMILDTFPRNVKALFRRAVASIKLKRFTKAERDLVEALGVEPSNKDVLRELEVVRGHLLIKENGKRVLEVNSQDCEDRNNKKPDVGIKDIESVVTEVMDDQSDVSLKDNVSVNMEVMETQRICANNTSVLEFSKKGGGCSRLRIPAQSYKKLLDGKKVSFYRKRDLTTLTIRILKSEATAERDIFREQCMKKRKRKRRRCPKKWKSKMTGATNEGMTPRDNINVKPPFPTVSLSESYTKTVNSRKSSTCDNFSRCGTHIPQNNTRGGVNDSSVSISSLSTASSICSPTQNDSNGHQPFIFSAPPKKCKSSPIKKPSCTRSTLMLCRYPFAYHVRDKWRRVTFKKNHSQGDESPRHNLSTFSKGRSFSHKFLRPRGVSVSCCRYSSETQLIKKRKEMFAHLASSNRPVKKFILSVNPICSLFVYPNNVIIKSDSESRVSSV